MTTQPKRSNPQSLVDLDAEISKIEAEIKQKEEILNALKIARKYVGVWTPSPVQELEERLTYSDGISSFILTFLQERGSNASTIKKAYAQTVGKPVVAISNNVSNALSRLKDKGKIEGVKQGLGTKSGNFWQLKKS